MMLAGLHSPGDAVQVMQRCLASVTHPVHLDNGEKVQVGASIGIAVSPPDGDGQGQGESVQEALLQRADAAMYEARRMGKGRIVLAQDGPDRPA